MTVVECTQVHQHVSRWRHGRQDSSIELSKMAMGASPAAEYGSSSSSNNTYHKQG